VALKSITLPVALKFIGDDAFEKCSSLTSIEIPVGVTSIGSDAFYECVMLQSAELPAALKKIGGSAFAKCPSLREVRLNCPAPPSISKSTFKDVVSCIFLVPRRSAKIYLEDKVWSKISSIKEMDY
jgi:hypothetical protein